MTTDTKAVARWDVETMDERTSSEGRWVLFTDHERVVGKHKNQLNKFIAEAERTFGVYEADLAASRAEVEGLKRDAERYRWLREQKRPDHLASERYIAVAVHDWTANLNPGRVGVNTWGNVTVSDEVLDRIVDAAMENGNV